MLAFRMILSEVLAGGVEISDNEPPSEDASNSHGSVECTGGPEISDKEAPTEKVEMIDATASKAPSEFVDRKDNIDNKPSSNGARLRELVCTFLKKSTCCR